MIDDEALQGMVPSITLQPLVENSIKHGMRNQTEGFILTISILLKGNEILVRIEDNGDGIEEARLERLLQQPVDSSTGTGIGLYNVNKRLEMMIGKESALSIESTKGIGTAIQFILPLEGVTPIENRHHR